MPQIETMASEVLWSRYQDGAEKVVIVSGGLTSKGRRSRKGWSFSVTPPAGGTPRVYQSARSLLVDITKHPTARHWTLDRYFGLGKYEPPAMKMQDSVGLTILEILDPSNALELRPQAQNLGMVLDPGLGVLIQSTQALGIDLGRRGEEVAKLLFAGFGHAIHASGLDPEDVLQEVYAGILVRNRGTCAFDPRKASFGHYVHMVAECVMSNTWRKYNRRNNREQTGATGYGDGEGANVDVQDSLAASQVAITLARTAGHPMDRYIFADLTKYIERKPPSVDKGTALRAIPLIHEGYGRSEIAVQLGLPKAAVSRGLTYLRRVTKEWMSCQ